MFQRISRVRALAVTTMLASVALLSACGGGSDDDVSPSETDQLITNVQVTSSTGAGFPHQVNIYKPKGATRAIVALHGGGGNNVAISYQLGLNSSPTDLTTSTINWAWLEANHVMLVLPQGQHIESNEGATTWNNYAMDSGQDDKAFLAALSAKIRSDYGVRNVTLMGHSMGGVMTNRMWCESNSSFDLYVSLAGPASQTFQTSATCAPGADPKPYIGIIGDTDPVMETEGNWDQSIWTINRLIVGITQVSGPAWVNDEVINEQVQQQVRATAMCGESVSASPTQPGDKYDVWTNCGNKLKLYRVHGAGHGVSGTSPDGTPSLATQMGFTASGSFTNGVGLVQVEEDQALTIGLK
ncbi:MAG TPA: hypothetical protein VLA61_13950 [Ideonella sp.]|uniref:alpha/beta hydrolase family esterase n=1 Tax=Ideonella sp. TaxID=1929293 RepID=UPI002BBC497C|nr:hypothetical protein [Ideonella sp.]HSI49373.1 hypothetical protein [Ideonella sp.]